MSIRVGIVGVGNCAKSLVQGVAYYTQTDDRSGLAFADIAGYDPTDIEFVLAYDVDERKVGKPLCEAINAPPNCAIDLIKFIPRRECTDTVVEMGKTLDGIASHMENTFFKSAVQEPSKEQVVARLKEQNVDILLLYLPVGSQEATEFYVECCLAAKVAFVNCIPVFIVSNPVWQQRIEEAGICAIGDDMRSQVGASVLSQVLQEMFLDRGAKVLCHYQLNHGGNTDFQNMLDQNRLASKKKSKENVITSQAEIREIPNGYVYAGPSDYISYLGDNKVANLYIEAEGFCGAIIRLDCKLSVQDSPNSAGVVIDAVRYLQAAKDLGIVGPLYGPSAFTQKTPPKQLPYSEAYKECVRLAIK